MLRRFNKIRDTLIIVEYLENYELQIDRRATSKHKAEKYEKKFIEINFVTLELHRR